MSNTTVSKLATALKISPEKLISQLNEAGVNVYKEVYEITNDQKTALLNHLRGSHGTKKEIKSPSKLTVNRRSQSELKLSGGFGTSRTVNVEIRKKKTYLSKESLIEEAKLDNLKQQKEEEQVKEKINHKEKTHDKKEWKKVKNELDKKNGKKHWVTKRRQNRKSTRTTK